MQKEQSQNRLIPPEELKQASKQCSDILQQLDRILLGRSELHRMVLAGLLSKGHILLEGVPGVGKTALVKALGQLFNIEFNRVQFTPDLMPGDILGMHVLQQNKKGYREMVFQPGPVFTNILLADEINRASPKTQSALLEAMQERCVTLLGETRELPNPFFVLASQNPIELKGTYPLPEAQLDRFLLKLNVANIKAPVLEDIISSRRRGEPPEPEWSLTAEKLNGLFEIMDRIYLPGPVSRYISRLVAATHPDGEETVGAVKDYVAFGSSPRGAIGIAETARARALIDGRPTAGFEDVQAVAEPVLNHRIILNYKARFDNVETSTVVSELVAGLDETEMNLPDDIDIKEDADD